jgi:hypothetical protein
MKKVLLYSPGSFDIDVLLNCIFFYSKLGFVCKVQYGKIRKGIKVQRFVYLRDNINEGDLALVDSDICDIYDYSKTTNLSSFNYISEKFIEVNYFSLTQRQRFKNFRNFKGYHPVYTKFWTHKNIKKTISFVHIGTRKASIRVNNADLIYLHFENILRKYILDQDLKLFGRGWEEFRINVSALNLFSVAKVYSKSVLTIGVLWDIQRYKTLNARYILAPLNGCFLYCEKDTNLINVPGVFSYDEIDLLPSMKKRMSHEKLRLESMQFWDKHTGLIAESLGMKYRKTAGLGLYNWFLVRLIIGYFKYFKK